MWKFPPGRTLTYLVNGSLCSFPCPHQTAGWRTGRKQSLSSPAPKSECFLHTRLVRFFFQPRCLPAHLEPVIMGWGHDFATQGESSAWSRCDLTWPPFHTPAPKPRLQPPFNHLVVLFRLSPNLKESVVSSAATPLTALERFQGEGTSPICMWPRSKQRTVKFTSFRFPQPDLQPTDSECPGTWTFRGP